jgi:hypothetical protein
MSDYNLSVDDYVKLLTILKNEQEIIKVIENEIPEEKIDNVIRKLKAFGINISYKNIAQKNDNDFNLPV